MTTEEYLEKAKDLLWHAERDENGVDLELIRRNLKLTPQERLRRGDRASREALRSEAASVTSTFLTAHQGLDAFSDDLDSLLAESRRKHEQNNEESLAYLLAIKRMREETGLK